MLSVQPRNLHTANLGKLWSAPEYLGQQLAASQSEAPTNATSNFFGTDGGGRTHTSVKTLDFESSASANSATSAAGERNCTLNDPNVNGFGPFAPISKSPIPWIVLLARPAVGLSRIVP